jgi:hypothetical protein
VSDPWLIGERSGPNAHAYRSNAPTRLQLGFAPYGCRFEFVYKQIGLTRVRRTRYRPFPMKSRSRAPQIRQSNQALDKVDKVVGMVGLVADIGVGIAVDVGLIQPWVADRWLDRQELLYRWLDRRERT